jgi:hypothetical protein
VDSIVTTTREEVVRLPSRSTSRTGPRLTPKLITVVGATGAPGGGRSRAIVNGPGAQTRAQTSWQPTSMTPHRWVSAFAGA